MSEKGLNVGELLRDWSLITEGGGGGGLQNGRGGESIFIPTTLQKRGEGVQKVLAMLKERGRGAKILR